MDQKKTFVCDGRNSLVLPSESTSKKKDHVIEDDDYCITGSGDENTDSWQLGSSSSEADAEAIINNSKKNKGTSQEEDDLDKVLAEHDNAPIVPKHTASPKEEKVQAQPEQLGSVDATGGEKEAATETGKSAAAKKNKKKKEKEKKAAAAAAVGVQDATQEETKSKKRDDKRPNHVIKMQEALQRRKELEERMRREEEEKERREEEEHLRQQELEKQAEEAKRRKKEKEKERMLMRKQEGKPITRKQKNEAHWLELVRNQFLTQKSKSAPAKENDGASTSNSADNLQLKEMDAAKNANIREVDSVAEPVAVVKKEAKCATSPDSGTAAKPYTASGGGVPQHLECEDVKSDVVAKNRRKDAAAKREAQTMEVLPKRGEDNLRSPICCIMGHVDTGKTKLLDCIRGTNVQEGEAGGITQQIGATYFPAENIRERTRELKADAKLRVPGLLVIDTPGHESFTNLRSRGSGLCDIAILVVDIMHGLERQTIESLNLLKMRNTEFIVALNKVDRLCGWKTCKNKPIVKAMKQQSKDVQVEFNWRLTQIITQFKEQGLNTELYYKNKEMGETFSIVPTSAISGEGIPDLLLLLVKWTEKTLVDKLMFTNEIQCTVLEVKAIEGQGTTIDVVLVNGVLHEGDQIVVCGTQGPIVTTIRALLTPHPMKELRIKGSYLHHKELKAAQGVKINAQGLDHAVAGTGLYVVGPDDNVEDIKEATMQDMKSVMSRIDKSGTGVCVQASTLGSLEALLEFLKSPVVNIPVSGINIGPVHKSDVRRACAMLERNKEYATILAFDVKVTPEARELAKENSVKIFTADIIYHLFDQFQKYMDNVKEEKKREALGEAVFPCRLRIMPDCVFNKKDPIVLGVNVLEGTLKTGTPICIRSDSGESEFIDIGQITSIQINHREVETAKKGQKVAIKILSQKIFGKHFTAANELVSHISRESVGILKAYFQDDMGNEDWKLLEELQRDFKIDQIYF
ncbi:hypothetical protein MKW92_041500 [Papaver armeniacum]|nr:hypothetical protein MKW92_041500 [Papaver armeniacum]